MKWIKRLLIFLAILLAIVLVAALIAPKEYAVEREIVINRPDSVVFDYIKYLKNQDNFSVWAKADPNMKKEFKGRDGTVGFISSWKSENPDVGSGKQEIVNITEGKRVDTELRFFEPFEAVGQGYMSCEQLDSARTRVVWGYAGEMAYPMNIMLLFMDMDGALGPQLAEGLSNLKTILEQ